MTTNRRARLIRHAAASLLLFSATPATPLHALWELAEGEVFVSLDTVLSSSSNIDSTSDERSDTIYSLTPGLSWERSRGRGSVSLGVRCEIERALDDATYDSENYSANFSLQMPVTAGRRLEGRLTLGYFDGSRVDAFQNTRLSESSYELGLNGSYRVSSKINARVGASYGKSEPEGLPGYEDTSLSVGLGYNIRPLVSLFLDVRQTDSSSDADALLPSGTDTSGKAFILGLSGEITPKLTGSIGFGYDMSETRIGSTTVDNDGLTYDANLSWSPRERTNVSLTASRGTQSTSTGGTAYESINLSGSQRIGLNMSVNAGVALRMSENTLQSSVGSDLWEVNIGATYAFARGISMGASYSYSVSDSAIARVDYVRSIWSLTASARF